MEDMTGYRMMWKDKMAIQEERYGKIWESEEWSAAICNTSLLSRLLHRWEVGDGEGRMRKEIKRNGSRKDRSNCRRDPAKMSFVILTFNWEGILTRVVLYRKCCHLGRYDAKTLIYVGSLGYSCWSSQSLSLSA